MCNNKHTNTHSWVSIFLCFSAFRVLFPLQGNPAVIASDQSTHQLFSSYLLIFLILHKNWADHRAQHPNKPTPPPFTSHYFGLFSTSYRRNVSLWGAAAMACIGTHTHTYSRRMAPGEKSKPTGRGYSPRLSQHSTQDRCLVSCAVQGPQQQHLLLVVPLLLPLLPALDSGCSGSSNCLQLLQQL